MGSHEQKFAVSYLLFPIVFAGIIYVAISHYRIKIQDLLKFTNGKVRFVFLSVLLAVFVFILQMALDWSFIQNLLAGHIKFLKFNSILDQGFAGYVQIISMVLVAPIQEEVFLRRLLFRKLLESYSTVVSIVITSFIFAVVHWSLPGLFAYFIIGVVFTYLYYLTGNIWINIMVHTIYNLLAGFTVFKVLDPSHLLYIVAIALYILSAYGIFAIFNEIRTEIKGSKKLKGPHL